VLRTMSMCDEDCSTSFVHGTVRTSSFIHPPLLVDVRQMSNAMMINIWYISCSFPLSYVRIPVGVVVRISSIVVTVVVIRIVAFVVIVGSCSAYSSKSSLHEETVLRCLLPLLCTISTAVAIAALVPVTAPSRPAAFVPYIGGMIVLR